MIINQMIVYWIKIQMLTLELIDSKTQLHGKRKYEKNSQLEIEEEKEEKPEP